MVKVLLFGKRPPGSGIDDFRDSWQYLALDVASSSSARRVVRNEPIASSYEAGRTPAFDGVLEIWYEERDVGGALRQLVAGDLPFVDPSSTLVTEEVVMKDGEPTLPRDGGVKMIQLISRRPDLSPEQFQSYWRDHHGPLARRNDQLQRYVQCHVRHDLHVDPPGYDGSPMTWFASFDSLRSSGRSEVLHEIQVDEANFMENAGGRLPFVIVHEELVPMPG